MTEGVKMHEFPEDWPELAWAKLPVDIRQRAVDRLRAIYSPAFFDEVRRLATEKGLTDWLPGMWHFGQGMQVRNALRSNGTLDAKVAKMPAPIRDEELPPLPEMYGTDQATWDDYYVQVLEAAAGLREIDPAAPDEPVKGVIPGGGQPSLWNVIKFFAAFVVAGVLDACRIAWGWLTHRP